MSDEKYYILFVNISTTGCPLSNFMSIYKFVKIGLEKIILSLQVNKVEFILFKYLFVFTKLGTRQTVH